MCRAPGWLLAGVWCALAAGCVAPQHRAACPPAPPAATPAESLPPAERGDLEATLLGASPVSPVQYATSPRTYRALTPEQCAALAANSSNLAGLYQLEAQTAPNRTHHPTRARCTQQSIMKFVSQEARNRSASAALETYFNLARAEASEDLIGRGLNAVQVAVRKTEDILKEKLRPGVELDVWQRQNYKLQSEQVQARNQVEQLNAQLRVLLGISGSPNSCYVWPQVDTPEPPEVADVEGIVAVALGQRPELRLLRYLIHDLDAETLSAIRPLLQTVSPLLGNRPALNHPCLLVLRLVMPNGPVREREVTVRRQQLVQLLHERERAVANEVRQAAHDLNAHRRLAALARRQAKSWKDKLDDLEDREAKGMATFAEITSARLECLKARGDVVAELVAVRVADVKLKQAQSFWGREGCATGPPPGPAMPPDATWSSDTVRLPELTLPAPSPTAR
jgi:outer membrane protein TolC